MSNTSVKVAIALLMVMATPAASFARGGGGGSAGMGQSGGVGGVRPNAGLIGPAQKSGDQPERDGKRRSSPDSAAAHNRPDSTAVQVIARRSRDLSSRVRVLNGFVRSHC